MKMWVCPLGATTQGTVSISLVPESEGQAWAPVTSAEMGPPGRTEMQPDILGARGF